ncbi:UDP-glucuronosyltransferase 2A1 [Chelonia mydas]|uniref:glucuronosyltransferase n=1 Tax=Chelonia mydas TaxID=8469 RepID=M7B1F4_CHEMY|nr:UDP-glucuronosyltransferase 2A1 [Chelonia mydas]
MAFATSVSKKHIQFIAFQVTLIGTVFCGNVLIWHTEASHWLNVKIIIQELIRREHNVTILVSNASLFITPHAEMSERFEVYPVPFGKNYTDSLIKEIVNLWLYNRPTTLTFWKFYKELGKLISKANKMNRQLCDGVLASQDLMARLQRDKYDVLLSDPVTIGGDLVALKLGIPFVYSLRFTPASTVERHCGKIPSPPSYAPAALSELTDQLSFSERIKNIVSYHLQDYVFQSYWGEWDSYYSEILGSCGKVLVWPTDGSHWLNIKLVLEELSLRGHNVTVLVPSTSLLVDYNESSSPFDFEVLPVPFTKQTVEALLEDFLHLWMYELPNLSYWEGLVKLTESMAVLIRMIKQTCDSVVLNPGLIAKLRQAGFDVLISDPLSPGGELIAEFLEIPFVYTFRFSEGNTVERLCGGLPAPPSYVPASTGRLTDRMSFMERLENMLFYALQDVLFHQVLWREWSQYYSDVLVRQISEVISNLTAIDQKDFYELVETKRTLANLELANRDELQQGLQDLRNHLEKKIKGLQTTVKGGRLDELEELGRPTTLCETMGKAEMWLIRTYWDFEFPRPFLPNFEFVGGLHCKPAKPLPEEMEEFVQSSGEHGIVVFSLGSMIYNLTEEKSKMVALALSQVPEKVLWRYKGKKPETLGPNTRIYDWIPQNDLLGHPKAKAFITHGGTNGIYEAIYHGIPMVGIPLFADQPDNIVHMKAKGIAVELDFNTMQAQDLIDALNMVINNSSYKENAVRLSQIHHDQPIKPLDRAVFWIEFVMRHKGAKHLRPAAHELTWYQYHCLDVLAFLLTCAAAAVFIAVKCCLFCCKKCGRIVKKKKME